MDMNFPEYGTPFHLWYERNFKEELKMSYTEIYKALAHDKHFMLGEIVKMYHHECEINWKAFCKQPLSYEIFDE